MVRTALHLGRRRLDGRPNAPIRHATAEIPAHDRADVLVTRIRIVLEEGRCLHDLPRLAIAALRNLQFDPGLLQRMLSAWIQPFDGRDLSARDGADRRDAGADRPALEVHGACATHADPASKLRAFEADDVTDHPQEWGIGGRIDAEWATVDLEWDS